MAHGFHPHPDHFTLSGAYYPKGHVFAMLPDAAAQDQAVQALEHSGLQGTVARASSAGIEEHFGAKVADYNDLASVGREEQFMARFLKLARAGQVGLLIEAPNDEALEQIRQALESVQASVAYFYRALVIEELIGPTPRAEAAGSNAL